jgi:2-polyprenyl-3-methyl-5-hydroxy-6-metoxy-1,4-benzoquinol methylase
VKYDGVDATGGGEETSHHLVLELVGTGKRVLDVGCATGYMASALVQAGNEVSGVEIDGEAAEKARPFLTQLVIGDLDRMDLSEAFPPKSFDVVIFADVLEHLKDPVTTLSRARALLDDGGFAVLSIPNVAHAAVRLALLKGRFEYSPLGLLDETHLRFFTRSTLEDLLSEGGFVAADVRRTTAPPFGTEIQLDPGEFPQELVDQVEADPDSATYQFVVKAVPVSGVGDPESFRAARAEVTSLREQVSAFSRALKAVPRLPVVGVMSGPAGTSPLDTIRQAVVLAELRRRLDGYTVRGYHSGSSPEALELTGEALHPAVDAAQADALIWTDSDDRSPDGAYSTACWATDPVVLMGRVIDTAVLHRRAEYLRLSGSHPAGDAKRIVLTELPGDGVASPLAALARRLDASALALPKDLTALDLGAVVADACAVVTGDRGVGLLAYALERPVIVLQDGDGDFVRWAEGAGLAVGTAATLPALAEDLNDRPAAAARQALWQDADSAFDELAGWVLAATSQATARTAQQRVNELGRRLSVLESVNACLRRRVDVLLATPILEAIDRPSAPAHETAPVQRALAEARSEVDHLHEEIERIYSTKLMRTVQPLRRVYGRVRSFRK